MTTFKKSLLPILSLALLSGAGCIAVQETNYTDVKRTHISFASDSAARTFYEVLSATGETGPANEKSANVSLILLNVSTRTIEGPNRRFNEAVQFCDSNADGEITDAEAVIFAREWPRFGGKK